MIRIFIGFDQREALAFHVCCQSIIEHASQPVAIYPLSKEMFKELHAEGSTDFVLSRYLVPQLCNYQGWAIFIDGDMVVDTDIEGLWNWQNTHADKAVAVVKHNYKTKEKIKYVGSTMQSPNVDYPRKNWSSVVLWNCAHPKNRGLDRGYIDATTPQVLHRFGWLDDGDIGALTPDWNYLVGEQSPSSAYVYHYTHGVPALKHYADDFKSWAWHRTYLNAMECGGEHAVTIAKRADERIGTPEKIRAVL
jgi:lipopolysaccharide biosynthesis glycosyltransferase